MKKEEEYEGELTRSIERTLFFSEQVNPKRLSINRKRVARRKKEKR